MEPEAKLRSVCDACTSAKLRCNGKVPCERCLKKGIECHYQPYKNRGGGGGSSAGAAKAKPQAKQPDALDTFMDEHERRSWSVFFTLYRSFGKGCSMFWFKQQTFKLLRFLESKAVKDVAAVNSLTRLKSWMTALGLDLNAPPPPCAKTLPRMAFPPTSPIFQTTVDDLKADAERRHLPVLSVDQKGVVEANDSFEAAFGFSSEAFQEVLNESGGGFLPWGGDLLARVFVREADLVLYLQSVSNSLDAIGKPTAVPSVMVVPSMSLVRARKRSGQEVLCMVRAVQQLFITPNNEFAHSAMIVFDLPEEPAMTSSGKHRTFDEANMSSGLDEQMNLASNKRSEPDDILPLPQDALGASTDDEWLDGLLTWAADEQPLEVMGYLPVADNMLELNLQQSA